MAGSPKRKIQLRRGDSSQWVSANPVLSQGEPGYDTTTGIVKIGNGLDAWTDLPSPSDVGEFQAVGPIHRLSVGVVGAEDLVISDPGVYSIQQASPSIVGLLQLGLGTPLRNKNSRITVQYNTQNVSQQPLYITLGIIQPPFWPSLFKLNAGCSAEFVYETIMIPGFGELSFWVCVNSTQTEYGVSSRKQKAEPVYLSRSHGEETTANISDGVVVLDDSLYPEYYEYIRLSLQDISNTENFGQQFTVVNQASRTAIVTPSFFYNSYKPSGNSVAIPPGWSATMVIAIFNDPDDYYTPKPKLVCLNLSKSTYQHVDISATGADFTETPVMYGTEQTALQTMQQKVVNPVKNSVSPIIYEYEFFVPYTVASGKNAKFILDLELNTNSDSGRVDSLWEYKNAASDPSVVYKSSNTFAGYTSTISTTEVVAGGGRKLLKLTGTISVRSAWFNLRLKYTEELTGGAGVVVHKESKLRVKQLSAMSYGTKG